MSTTYRSVTDSMVGRLILEDRSKRALNQNPFQIPQFRVVAWKPDGTLEQADCTMVSAQDIAGVTAEIIYSMQSGLVRNDGTLAGAVVGLGAVAGAPVFLGIPAGTLTTTPPTGPNVTVIRIGYAEPGNDSTVVTDLRLDIEAAADTGIDVDAVKELIAADKTQSVTSSDSVVIPQYRVVAWHTDGTVRRADSSISSLVQIAGITLASIVPSGSGQIAQEGKVKNALTSLMPAAGTPIFLSPSVPGGLSVLAPTSGIVVRVGYAEPSDGLTGPGVDLRLDMELINEG